MSIRVHAVAENEAAYDSTDLAGNQKQVLKRGFARVDYPQPSLTLPYVDSNIVGGDEEAVEISGSKQRHQHKSGTTQ